MSREFIHVTKKHMNGGQTTKWHTDWKNAFEDLSQTIDQKNSGEIRKVWLNNADMTIAMWYWDNILNQWVGIPFEIESFYNLGE